MMRAAMRPPVMARPVAVSASVKRSPQATEADENNEHRELAFDTSSEHQIEESE